MISRSVLILGIGFELIHYSESSSLFRSARDTGENDGTTVSRQYLPSADEVRSQSATGFL
jgi:hypothetical protein